MWWDTDSSDVTAEDCVARGNAFSGPFVENNPGPALIRRRVVTDATLPPTAVDPQQNYPAALSLLCTPDVTPEANVVLANDGVPALGVGPPGDHSDGPDFETNAKAARRSDRQTIHRNVFVARHDDAVANLPNVDVKGKPMDFLYPSLSSGPNLFWNPDRAAAFDNFAANTNTSRRFDLAAWQA